MMRTCESYEAELRRIKRINADEHEVAWGWCLFIGITFGLALVGAVEIIYAIWSYTR